jgi:methylthioribose-1-phosphate isomerase
MRTVEWDYTHQRVEMIDQRLLPGKFQVVSFDDYHQIADAIRVMVVRGAPAIGAAGAFGYALAAQKSQAKGIPDLRKDLDLAAGTLKAARPTAINLAWAIDLLQGMVAESEISHVADMKRVILEQAQRMADEDVEINKRMAEHGANLMQHGETVIHHCNTGALATVDWGTALGVIRMAHQQGKQPHVLALA